MLPGFAYADVPQMGPSVVVVTDGDAGLARREADRLAARLWDARESLVRELPSRGEIEVARDGQPDLVRLAGNLERHLWIGHGETGYPIAA